MDHAGVLKCGQLPKIVNLDEKAWFQIQMVLDNPQLITPNQKGARP